MLLVTAVFAVFYPSLFSEICLVDDYGSIMSTLNDDNLSFGTIFFPRSLEGGYYRPLIGLSYWFDRQVWFLDEHLMHFESVVAHLCNALLVYFICRKADGLYRGKSNTWIPLFAALLFSLHPVVTESVNWISGRTDIMMGNFVLLSVLGLLHFRETGKRWLLVFALVSAGIALLAKEAAFGFLIGIPLLLWFPIGFKQGLIPSHFNVIRFLVYYSLAVLAAIFIGSYWVVLLVCAGYSTHLLLVEHATGDSLFQTITVRRVQWFTILIAVTALLFVALRKLAFTSSVAKIGQTVTLMFADTSYTISLFIGAAGFYVKKFFLPLPLNFFITEIDPLYDFLGIAILLLCMHLLVVRSLPSVMCVMGFLLMAPALPFAFGTIAWNAYAERYIYLSSAFWVIAILLFAGRHVECHERINSAVICMAGALCFLAAVASYNRNVVWQTNVALMRDTVAQSPKKRKLRDIYIHALLNARRLNEAEKEYRYALQHFPTYDDKADLMVGGLMVKEGRFNDALELYQNALIRTKFSSEPLLASVVRLLREMKQSGRVTNAERLRLSGLEQEYAARLYSMTRNPSLLIEGGTAAMRAGSFSAAYTSFDAALRYMSPTDHQRRAADRLKSEARNQLNEQ